MNWINTPPWTSQYSVLNRVDVMDCLSESFINICYMVTGFDASPRALAKMSNTTPQGNYEGAITAVATTAKQGLIPYYLWPSPHDFQWSDYYATIPQVVLNAGIQFRVDVVAADLNISPLWTILRFPNGAQHGVCQINETQYFDSEQGNPIKDLTYGAAVVVSQQSLIFTPMTNAKLIKNGNEWGFYLPATNEQAMIDKAINLNYPLPTTNNGQNVDWQNVKPEITIS